MIINTNNESLWPPQDVTKPALIAIASGMKSLYASKQKISRAAHCHNWEKIKRLPSVKELFGSELKESAIA